MPLNTGATDLVSDEVGSDRADPAPENNRVSVTTAILAEGGFSAGRFSMKSDGTLRLALETQVGVRYRLERSKPKKGGTVEVGRMWRAHWIGAEAAGSFDLFRFFRQNRLAAPFRPQRA